MRAIDPTTRAWWKACLAAVCLSSLAAAAPGGDIWSAFLDRPSEENYARVAQAIRNCPRGSCKAGEPDYDQTYKLIRLVELGNRHALTLAFLSRPLLDGGPDDARESSGSHGSTPSSPRRPNSFPRSSEGSPAFRDAGCSH